MGAPAERFTLLARSYAEARPGYPPAAIAALFEGCGAPFSTVADLGAGTGISARALARHCARVFAIEPNAAMRAAAEPDPRVTWIDGTAEVTTLPDASVDLAVALQAWHWFDAPAAMREARRIVRRGGRVALVGYERDESDETTAAYGSIVRRFALDDTESRRARALADFGAQPGAVRTDFKSAQVLDRSTFVARLDSTSYLPHEGDRAAELLREAHSFFERRACDGAISLHQTIALVYTAV